MVEKQQGAWNNLAMSNTFQSKIPSSKVAIRFFEVCYPHFEVPHL